MKITSKESSLLEAAKRNMLSLFAMALALITLVFAKYPAEYRQPMATVVTKSLNTSYQLSTSRDAMVSYSVMVTSTLNLTAGQNGTVNLQISPNNSTWTTIATQVNNNNGSLTLGFTTNVQSGSLTGFVPMGYYVRMATTGTSTFAWQSGMEVLL